jgi:hypothetical protein
MLAITTVPDLLHMNMSAEKDANAVLVEKKLLQKVVSTYCQTFQIKNLVAVNKLLVVAIIVLMYHHLELLDFMFHFVQLHHIRMCALRD